MRFPALERRGVPTEPALPVRGKRSVGEGWPEALPGRSRQAAAGLALCFVILLSLIPGDMQVRTGVPKEVEHLAAYVASGFLFARAVSGGFRAAIGVLGLVVLAGGLELLQELVPGRTPSLVDWAADSLGSIAGTVFAAVWSHMRRLIPLPIQRRSPTNGRAELTRRNSTDRQIGFVPEERKTTK